MNSRAKETTSSFKLVPKNKRKIRPREMSAMTSQRKPSEAKEKSPKEASETKDPPNPGMVGIPKKPHEVNKTLSKPGAANKKAHKKGCKQAKKFSPF